MNLSLLTGGCLLTGILLWLEWRRPDRRHLLLRVLATLLAVMALGFAAFRVTSPALTPPPAEAALWTAGSTKTDVSPPGQLRFALPDASPAAPADAVPMPDVATLRRRHPEITTLHVYGDGIDPASLPSLLGLRVFFHSPLHSAIPGPGISFLHCPRELPLGDPLVVEGRAEGVPVGSSLPVSLEAPDGNTSETVTGPADTHGEANFTIRASPLAAPGRFVWHLRLGQTTETLGVSVVPPLLPRVLVLEGEPHFDTAALRRWFESAGGTLTVRTRVGKDHFRFASSRQDPPALNAITTELLADFDFVLADSGALADLSPDQRTSLAAAVEKTGLGLLVLAEDTPFPAETPPDLLALLPWKLLPGGDAPAGEERTARPRWPGEIPPSEVALPVAPVVIAPRPDEEILADDRRGQTLVAAVRRGRGKLALTLVRDTTRWQRENEFSSFAAYWSSLFSELSRPADEMKGRWVLLDGESGPALVDRPLQFRWSGSPRGEPGDTVVTGPSNTATINLPLMQFSQESAWWQGTFWPRRPGWHRLVSASGATLGFFVHDAHTWPVVQASRRRAATELFASQSESAQTSAPTIKGETTIHPGWWFALFVVAAGYLWIERRFASR